MNNSTDVLNHMNLVTGRKSRVVPQKAKDQIARLKKDGYTYDDIATAITNCSKDEYHIETNYKYLTMEFITRPAQFDKWFSLGKAESPNPKWNKEKYIDYINFNKTKK